VSAAEVLAALELMVVRHLLHVADHIHNLAWQDEQAGPVKQNLCQYGNAGGIHAGVLGTSRGASQGAKGLCDLAAGTLAHGHLQFYDSITGQVKAMYAHQTRRRWSNTSLRG
jgi:hypothetical protein